MAPAGEEAGHRALDRVFDLGTRSPPSPTERDSSRPAVHVSPHPVGAEHRAHDLAVRREAAVAPVEARHRAPVPERDRTAGRRLAGQRKGRAGQQLPRRDPARCSRPGRYPDSPFRRPAASVSRCREPAFERLDHLLGDRAPEARQPGLRHRIRVLDRAPRPGILEPCIAAATPEAAIYTDEAVAHAGIPNPHEAVKHSVSEYVRGAARTNGIESFRSMFKRGYVGTFHQIREKHLDRYVTEFSGSHNVREPDTIDQMADVVTGMKGMRLRSADPIADHGPASGARTT